MPFSDAPPPLVPQSCLRDQVSVVVVAVAANEEVVFEVSAVFQGEQLALEVAAAAVADLRIHIHRLAVSANYQCS